MANKEFYSLTTKKKVLHCNHYNWLYQTQELYNKVLFFYYKLFLETEELWGMGTKQCLRELEKLTIVGRDKIPVKYPLPCKVPLYFRRAAINAAVSAGKSCLSSGSQAGMAKQFNKAVTYYKGMYREFTETGIELKVWTGEQWKFLKCRLNGVKLPENAEILSPSVVVSEKFCWLHIPIKEKVEDGRKAEERMKQGARICCIQFTNEDALAACVILDREGNQEEVFFIRGGKEYLHCCRKILNRLENSKKAMGTSSLDQKANRRYWEKLKNISDYFSNSISRQIINKSVKAKIDIIVIPKYEEKYTQVIMGQVGKWSPLYLSYRIREQLKYKAWREGILVLEINPMRSSLQCAICGAEIHKEGEQFYCENGHRGNRHLNAARNLGKRCKEGFHKETSR